MSAKTIEARKLRLIFWGRDSFETYSDCVGVSSEREAQNVYILK